MQTPRDAKTNPHASGGPAGAEKDARAAFGLAARFAKSGPLAAAVAVVAALGAGYLLWPTGAKNPAPQFGPPPVTVSKPLVEERIEWKEFTGQFEAAEFVEVRARVSGYLKSIHFEDGKLVAKGDLLFVIEPEPFELALATAKAQLADALARLELAKVQLARTAELAKRDFAAISTRDQRIAEQRSAEAAVNVAKAAVGTAEINLAYTRLTAPITGRVSRNEVSVGNLVIGGASGTSTLLTTIVSLDPIEFVFDVSEGDSLAYRRRIEAGEVPSARDNPVPIFAQLPDETDWRREGVVNFVDNAFNRSSGTLRVRASFPNPDLFVAPGQFGRVRVPVSKPKLVAMVPDAAIASDQARKVVFVVADDGTVGVKPVSLGPRVEGNLRIVRAGLDPNDRVVINGLMRVRPGAKVTAQEGRIQPGGEAKP